MNFILLTSRLLSGSHLRLGYLDGSLRLHTLRREPCAPLVLLGRKFQRTTSLAWLEWTTHKLLDSRAGHMGDSLERLFVLLRGWGVRGLTRCNRSWRDYRYTARGENGVMLAWGRADDLAASVHVCIPQSQLETMPLDVIHAVLNWICQRPYTATRIDLAIDDRTRITSLEQICEAVGAGRVMMRSRKTPQPYVDQETGKIRLTGYHFGSRKSDTFLRVYDKAIEQQKKSQAYLDELHRAPKNESESDRAARLEAAAVELARVNQETSKHGIRFELQLHDERAWSVLSMMAGSDPPRWDELAVGLLRGNLDFRDTDVNKNISRCPLLDWWRDFVTTCDAITISGEKTPETVERFVRYVSKQLAPTLALLSQFAGHMGGEWVRDLLRQGRERYSDRHQQLSELIALEARDWRPKPLGSVVQTLRMLAGLDGKVQ